jgi:hypothetical protein
MIDVNRKPDCRLVGEGYDLFIVFNGTKIAVRGKPGSPQARTWVVLEPGFSVAAFGRRISISYSAPTAS